MSRFMRGPFGFLAGWAERGLLAIGVLLRLFQSCSLLGRGYGGFCVHVQEKPLKSTEVSRNLHKHPEGLFGAPF
jgi:hypothetical protein